MIHLLSSIFTSLSLKDKALLGRLEKICHCVLNNSWPRNPRMEPSRSHGHSHAGQNHAVTLPGAFDRTELMRQPAATVGGEDGPRGEMAEGLLSPDKNFKVTSVSTLEIRDRLQIFVSNSYREFVA